MQRDAAGRLRRGDLEPRRCAVGGAGCGVERAEADAQRVGASLRGEGVARAAGGRLGDGGPCERLHSNDDALEGRAAGERVGGGDHLPDVGESAHGGGEVTGEEAQRGGVEGAIDRGAEGAGGEERGSVGPVDGAIGGRQVGPGDGGGGGLNGSGFCGRRWGGGGLGVRGPARGGEEAQHKDGSAGTGHAVDASPGSAASPPTRPERTAAQQPGVEGPREGVQRPSRTGVHGDYRPERALLRLAAARLAQGRARREVLRLRAATPRSAQHAATGPHRHQLATGRARVKPKLVFHAFNS